MDSPRKYLAELSPITQRTASIILDLPHPLGPTTAVRLVGKGTVVGSTKDLNPANLIDFRRMSRALLHENTQNLLSLVFTEGLYRRLKPFSVSTQSCVTQAPEKDRGLPYAVSKVLKRNEIGATDRRPEIFQRFLQKRVINQFIGVTHYPKARFDDLFSRIWPG